MPGADAEIAPAAALVVHAGIFQPAPTHALTVLYHDITLNMSRGAGSNFAANSCLLVDWKKGQQKSQYQLQNTAVSGCVCGLLAHVLATTLTVHSLHWLMVVLLTVEGKMQT